MRTKLGFLCACAVMACLAAGTQATKPVPAIAPIVFERGASSAEVSGAVVRGEQALYSLGAREGQQLTASVTSEEKNAVFQLYGPGAKPEWKDAVLRISGEALKGAAEGDDATHWSGKLPRSGDYLLVVGASRGNASYRLRVAIR